jgi:hypothetical protein
MTDPVKQFYHNHDLVGMIDSQAKKMLADEKKYQELLTDAMKLVSALETMSRVADEEFGLRDYMQDFDKQSDALKLSHEAIAAFQSKYPKETK